MSVKAASVLKGFLNKVRTECTWYVNEHCDTAVMFLQNTRRRGYTEQQKKRLQSYKVKRPFNKIRLLVLLNKLVVHVATPRLRVSQYLECVVRCCDKQDISTFHDLQGHASIEASGNLIS